MKKTVSGLLRQYGRPVTLRWIKEDSGTPMTAALSAIIQPLRYKNKMYLDNVHTRAGVADQGYFLYIGPPDAGLADLPDDVRIIVQKKEYLCVRRETVFLKNEALYEWAVLRPVC